MNRTELDELMLRMKRGDEKAFTTLYEETSKTVYAFILSYSRNREVSEDIMQETYIRVKVNIESFKGGNPIPWIMQIAKNLYLNYYTKSKKEVFTDFSDDTGQYGFSEIDTDTPVLNLILKVLNKEDAQIVTLYLVSGYKHREIAEIMDKPLGTVLWSYRQSMKKLKQIIEEEGIL